MKEYLNVTMKDNKKAEGKNVARFRRAFGNAVATVHKELGPRPFHLRGPLNTAVLDAVLGTIIAHHDKLRKDWKAGFERQRMRSSRRLQLLLQQMSIPLRTAFGLVKSSCSNDRRRRQPFWLGGFIY
jgi:hypothetical protein